MTLKTNLSILSLGTALLSLSACSGEGDGEDNGSSGGTSAGTGGAAATGGVAATGGAAATGGDSGATGGTAATGGAAATGGGSPGTGGDTGGSPDVCAPFANFEDGDNGFWIRNNPGVATGGVTITPDVSDWTGEAVTLDSSGGANDTTQSFSYVGSGFDSGDGEDNADGGPGGINIANNLEMDDCKDATAYDGVSVWAKGTVDASMKYGGIDADTVIIFVNDGTTEYSYRAALPDDASTWGEIKIPFDAAGWAPSAPTSLSAISYVKLMVAGKSFDVSFDEIGWYKD